MRHILHGKTKKHSLFMLNCWFIR